MSKKFGMSTMGYAIVLVIILGIVMIVSALMMVNKVNNHNNNSDNPNKNNSSSKRFRLKNTPKTADSNVAVNSLSSQDNEDYSYSDEDINDDNFRNFYSEIERIDKKISSRIDNLEMQQREFIRNYNTKESISNKYVCSIEGELDAENNVVPINNQGNDDIKNKKFVFVCQYK